MLAWSLFTVRATHSSKTFLEIAALEKSSHRMLEHGSPEAVLGLISIVVNLLENVKVLIDQAPQVGGLRIAWPVQSRRFGACSHHEEQSVSRHQVRNRTRIQLIHPMPSMADRLTTSCRKYTSFHGYGRALIGNRAAYSPLNDVSHWGQRGCEARPNCWHRLPAWKTCSPTRTLLVFTGTFTQATSERALISTSLGASSK